jgi:hypothetical protein
VQRAPGLPCALCTFEGGTTGQTSGNSGREIAKLCLAVAAVIASEAKQSIEQQERKLDCFASLAMTAFGVLQ